MKKTHFKIGLLTACLISVSSVASAQSCGAESCDSGACKCSKKHCDDKGLLEVINSAASNFEARLASMIPDRDRPAKSSCNCAKCSTASGFATHYTEVAPKSVPHIAPPLAQPDVVHPPTPRMKAPSNPIVDPVPVPHSGTHEVVPLPDSRNNPFKDDPTTRNLRPVPARPASYLRSNNKVEVEFDPQASNEKSMRSILMAKASSRSISDSALSLAKTTSTRRTRPLSADEQVEQPYSEQAAPEVIPASLSVPVSNLRSLKSVPTDQFVNPLRAQ